MRSRNGTQNGRPNPAPVRAEKPKPRTSGEIRIAPRADVERISQEDYKRYMKGQADRPIIGAMEATRLMDQRQFIFRQKMYKVPPVEADVAAQILDCQERIRKNAKVGIPLEVIRNVFADAARLSKIACRPAGFVRRLLWFLPFYNPFTKATPYEVGRHLGFFSMWIVFEGELLNAPQAESASGTSSPTSPASRSGSRRGAIRRGGRSNAGAGYPSRGDTS